MNSKGEITIKGYVKHAKKAGKQFDVFVAVAPNGDGTAKYATIKFCKRAADDIESIKKKLGNEFPMHFSFKVDLASTNVKSKIVVAMDENANPVIDPETNEPKVFTNVNIFIDGEIREFQACDTVFEGIGETANEWGR